jgi:hypothetical protein
MSTHLEVGQEIRVRSVENVLKGVNAFVGTLLDPQAAIGKASFWSSVNCRRHPIVVGNSLHG